MPGLRPIIVLVKTRILDHQARGHGRCPANHLHSPDPPRSFCGTPSDLDYPEGISGPPQEELLFSIPSGDQCGGPRQASGSKPSIS